MSKDGRIGNRDALKTLADFLEMEGVRRAPIQLNLDQVLTVIDLTRVGAEQPASAFQAFNTVQFSNIAFNVGGLNNFTQVIFDHANNPALIGRDAKVLAVSLEISGPVDAADTPMHLRLQYGIGTALPSILRLDRWEQTTLAAAWARTWALGGGMVDTFGDQGPAYSGWSGFIPNGQSLDMVVTRTAGNWPAASIATVRAIQVNVPTGRRIPG